MPANSRSDAAAGFSPDLTAARYCRLWPVFVLALVLRLGWLLLLSRAHTGEAVIALFPDSLRYHGLAEYMLGKGWRFPDNVEMTMSDPVYRSGEGALLLSGPGYAAAVAVLYWICGPSAWAVLLAQAIASSVGCWLVARLALELFRSARIARFAGAVAAVSITSIALSAALLTESLFFALLVGALLLIVRGLRTSAWGASLAAGTLFAGAALVKPVLTPVPALVAILGAFSCALPRARHARRPMVQMVAAASIPMIALGVWALRNHVRHGVFDVAQTGLHSMRFTWVVRAQSLESTAGVLETQQQAVDEFRRRVAAHELPSFESVRRDDASVVRHALQQHPIAMLRAFAANVIQNCIAPDDLHGAQLPALREIWKWTDPFLRQIVGPAIAILTWTALALMFGRFRWQAMLLGGIYLYFAISSGASFWQGSRYLYPAQCVTAIAIAWLFAARLRHLFSRRRFDVSRTRDA